MQDSDDRPADGEHATRHAVEADNDARADGPAPRKHRTPPDGRCPPGMLLVEGGTPTKAQQRRWSEQYPGTATSAVADFCMQKTPNTLRAHLKCIANGWCTADTTILGRCSEDGKDETGQRCENQSFARTVEANAAEAECVKQGWRLVTVAEWLWATGGGDEDRHFAWGDAKPTGKHLNVADPLSSVLTCEQPGRACPRGKEDTKYALLREDDGYTGVAPVGSYPQGAGRWGQLDLLGNREQLVAHGEGHLLCGGNASTFKRDEIDLHKSPCGPCPTECDGDDPARSLMPPCETTCKGMVRCVADPVQE